MKAVQRMLGHASAQITLDRYSHLYEDDLEDLADAMDARYRAAQVRPRCGPKPNQAKLSTCRKRLKRVSDQGVLKFMPS